MAAVERVVAGAAAEAVVAGAASEGVGVGGADERVVAGARVGVNAEEGAGGVDAIVAG